jgi:anti-sigma-K factor RskA
MNAPAQGSGDLPEGGFGAAEYVLGVLDRTAHRDAELRIAHDATFARDVAAWQRRLAPLLDEIAPVPAPFALWPRIQAAVGLESNSAAAAASSQRPTASLWRNLGFWRGLAGAALAAAVASVAALFLSWHAIVPSPPAVATQELVATLAQDDGKALFVATIDAQRGRLIVQPLAVSLPQGRVAELWLIPPGDAPHSLGIVDAQHAQPVIVPTNLRAALGPNAIVAITVEPPGGGPGGKPSGPVLAKGSIGLLQDLHPNS